jgi:hypothetical protein
MIKNHAYKLTNLTFNKEVATTYINMFWDDIYTGIVNNSSDSHIMLLVKIHFSDDTTGYRTIGHLRSVNFTDKGLFTNYIVQRLGTLNDSYSISEVSKIIFSYVIKEGQAKGDRALLSDITDKGLQSHRFNNMDLPITMIPEEYGILLSKPSLYDTFSRYFVQSTTTKGVRIYQIDVSHDKIRNEVTILGGSDLKWIDTVVSESVGCFKREIQKSTLYFLDSEIVLRKQLLPSKAFKKGTLDHKISTYFATMDIETIKENGKLVPYLICAYNGYRSIESYGLNREELFKNFIHKLVTMIPPKALKLTAYAHNLSGFDGVFLMNQLVKFGEVEPLVFNGKIMSIKVHLNIEGYIGRTIIFKDSYLLLPNSLRKLGELFKIEVAKTYFPFHLTDIFYKGPLPDITMWDITSSEYRVLAKRFRQRLWVFEHEAIRYCKIDCIALHQIITKFNEFIFEQFSINVHGSLTLPALAMRIFKAIFMPEDTIYQLTGDVEKAIRESYTGGSVDVYKPHNKIGNFSISNVFRKLFYYDVNSLYPFVMAFKAMPIGRPIAFQGNIRRFLPNCFGFFYCDITSPSNLQHPILQRRVKTASRRGMRTIAGLGTWTGWVCSVEMDRCIELGYQFTIIRGYHFETGDIFSSYIKKLYELRLSYPKGHPLNDIAKLLMNSLYGKFGMRTEITRVEIFNISSAYEREIFHSLLDTWGETVHDWFETDTHLFVVKDSIVDLKYNEEQNYYHGLDVNIAIASAITSHARVVMSAYKNSGLFTLYYSDTDSIVIDRPLPEALVGVMMGQMKLEYVIQKAVFLAPKVYGLITENGEEIIKVKGINPAAIKANNIGFSHLSDLLIVDSSRAYNQEKWYKHILEGTITVSDVAYTLKATSNKRQSVYINGVYEATTPYFYDKIENN